MNYRLIFIISGFMLFTSSLTKANSNKLLIGAEISNSFLGEPLSDYHFDSGAHDITYLNETILFGPTLEYLINSHFSIRTSTQLQFKYKNIQAKNRTFSSFSIPFDVQGFYWVNNSFKLGGGLNVITAHSLTDKRPISIEDINSDQVIDTYQFKTSVAPIFTIQIHDWFNPKDNDSLYYLGLSYSPSTYTIDNYNSDMLLDQNIDGNKFMISFGFSLLQSRK